MSNRGRVTRSRFPSYSVRGRGRHPAFSVGLPDGAGFFCTDGPFFRDHWIFRESFAGHHGLIAYAVSAGRTVPCGFCHAAARDFGKGASSPDSFIRSFASVSKRKKGYRHVSSCENSGDNPTTRQPDNPTTRQPDNLFAGPFVMAVRAGSVFCLFRQAGMLNSEVQEYIGVNVSGEWILPFISGFVWTGLKRSVFNRLSS